MIATAVERQNDNFLFGAKYPAYGLVNKRHLGKYIQCKIFKNLKPDAYVLTCPHTLEEAQSLLGSGVCDSMYVIWQFSSL